MDRIDWVLANCRLLAAIGEEFDRTQPFAGLRIGTGIHLEPKTVALLPHAAAGRRRGSSCRIVRTRSARRTS